ncbi:hypothetical protein D0T53_13260 [Dysgonomonas sp. 216]|nr:hypothetical protein [Dysgonomonas sp. 216]
MFSSVAYIFKQLQVSDVTNLKKRRLKMIQYLVQMLLIALVISICCIGIFATTWKDMIFYSLSIKIEKWFVKITSFKIGVALCKPLFRCPICMSSFWTVMAWIISGFSFNLLLMILLVCGLNTVLTSIISNILPDE